MGLRVKGKLLWIGLERPVWCYLNWVLHEELESACKGHKEEHSRKRVQKPEERMNENVCMFERKQRPLWNIVGKGKPSPGWGHRHGQRSAHVGLCKPWQGAWISKNNEMSLEGFQLVYVFKKLLTLVTVWRMDYIPWEILTHLHQEYGKFIAISFIITQSENGQIFFSSRMINQFCDSLTTNYYIVMEMTELQWDISTWMNQKIIISGKVNCRMIYTEWLYS